MGGGAVWYGGWYAFGRKGRSNRGHAQRWWDQFINAGMERIGFILVSKMDYVAVKDILRT
jgi:hypothetical protein